MAVAAFCPPPCLYLGSCLLLMKLCLYHFTRPNLIALCKNSTLIEVLKYSPILSAELMSFDKCIYPRGHHPIKTENISFTSKSFPGHFPSQPLIFFFNVSSYQALAMCQASGTSPVSLKPWEPGGEVAVVLFIRPRCSEWAFLGGIRLL